MGLFNRNNNNRNNNIKVVNVENIQAMKESILAGNYVEIQFPTITSITDNIIKASESGSFFETSYDAAERGVSTLWNITKLWINKNACSIELGGRLFPYKLIDCVMKHPVNILRYGLVLTNGEVVNFNFTIELQCVATLELFQDFGVEVIE